MHEAQASPGGERLALRARRVTFSTQALPLRVVLEALADSVGVAFVPRSYGGLLTAVLRPPEPASQEGTNPR